MATLNLRGVPDELAQRLKADAALAGRSLRDYCVLLLSGRGVEGNAKGQTADHLSITSSRRDKMGARNAEQVSSPAAPKIKGPGCWDELVAAGIDPITGEEGYLERDSGIVHDPEFCQDRNCRECRKLRSAN